MKVKLLMALTLTGLMSFGSFASLPEEAITGASLSADTSEALFSMADDDRRDNRDRDRDRRNFRCVAVKRGAGIRLQRFVGTARNYRAACREALRKCERSFPRFGRCILRG